MGGMTGAVLTATVLIAVHMGMIGGANTWYVDSSFTGGSQAGTQANPCVSLSCALSLSTLSDGDRISVAAGGPDYTGAANSQLTTSKSGISIFGAGLPSKVVLRSTESDVRAFTISSGSIVLLQNMTIRDFNLHSTTLGAGVYVGLKTNLTLLNVDMFNNSAFQGGAVSVIEDSVVKMVNCQFVGNTALTGGGAASVDKASLEATSSSFSFNVAKGNPAAQIFGDGGAILYYGESQNYLRLVSGTFSNNTAAEAGGAIHVTSVSTLQNSFSVYETTFEYNSVTGIGRCTSSTLCNVRGGAIYSSVPSSLLQNAVFIGNEASTDAVNQVAEGGAIFSTSVYEDDRQGLVTNIKGAKFSNNYASGCGGAAYLLNQVIIVDGSDFLGNTAGIKTNLFSDTSSNGGALWYSAPYSSQSSIKGTNFTDNFVWGGWGGAIFATDSPLQVLIEECQFTANKAFSSYTFLAQGGAIMISHNSIANLYRNLFVNNTASPRSDVDTTKGPFTLSGAGGAIYVHSANITTTECQFFRNFALTGQFDSGSSGGALLIEDSSYSVVEKCVFQNNAAVGYLGYSSYASSGAAGAVVLKFSSALISNSNFSENWVSVGGTQLSTGGAVAVFFDYNGNDESEQDAGVSIENSIFYDNTAYGQLCTANSPKAGQGGAVAIVGSSLPGVKMTGVSFLNNAAVSRTGFVLSFGGAVSVSVASNVTGVDCLFDQNMALYGLGNDISALEGESVLASRLNFKDSRFSAASSTQVINNRKRLSLKEKLLCSAVTRIIANIIPTDDDDHDPDRRRRRALSDNRKAYDPLPDWLLELQEKELLNEQQHQQQREENPRSLGLLRTGEGVGQAIKAAMMSTPHATIDSDDTLPAFYHYPSVLITSGSARLINPVFEGNYHVFLGDLLSVLLSGVPSASTSTSSSSATTSCSASIYGNVIQQSLTLTVFQSTLTLASFYEKSVSLKKMTLINGTLNVANNITVGGNSSFISSTISGKLDLSQLSGPIPAFLKSNYHPLIKFKGDLFTGFNLAEVKTLQNLNPAAAVILLGLRPIINVDSCTLKLYKSFDINTPHRTRESPVSEPLSLYMTNNALINVTSGATMLIKTTTFVMSSTSTSPAIVNFGTIILDGTYAKSIDQKGDDDIPSPGGDDDGKNNDGGRNQRTVSSLDNTLNVDGAFEQAPTGKLILTLNSTGQTRPVLTLVSNATFFGTIVVKFLDEPNVILYNGVPSSWELISYSQASASSVSNTNKPAMLVAPPGVGLYKKSLKTKAWTDTYVLDALACSDVLSYSAGIKENSNNLFPCYLCLSNSSCSFCNNGQCMDSSAQCGGTAGGVQYQSSCCKDNCNTPNGRCLASEDNTEFTCECTPFYTGDTCKNLSNISIVLITLAGALVVVIGILFYSYRSTMGKKTQVLEELRQGLLYDQQHMDHRSSTTAINEAYIQSLQQGLILKDVSVKWQEINIEKQVGEGSFGVVFKATFRGASVAVKKMRPLFSELSPKDIEEFNKEAYMMSRLRHPNIVLVMGISFVDQDIIPMPPRRTSIADHREGGGGGGDGDDGGFSSGNPLEKKVLPKAVAIVTEFLEQGSLADILYGPHRLPAEIWTYDLILTCALQAARGMLYLHTHSPPICHRDLKSSNLVVDDHWVVKVTDFGMSRILPEKIRDPLLEGKGPAPSDVASTASAAALLSAAANAGGRGGGGDNDSHNSYGSINSAHSTTSIRNLDGSLRSQTGGTTAGPEMTSNLGTTAWCAPELLTSSSTTRYSIKVDVYSFGMVLWEMWEKKRPYEELHSRFDIMDAVRSGRRPLISDSCPPAYKSLLQRCWQAEPGRRPNFQYIVRYLKDELARVKRQRERQLSTSASETPYSYFGSGFGRGPGQASPTNTSSKFSQLLPWNRPAASIEDGVGIGTYAPPNQPQPVPSSRASLAAVNDHNLAYLAASPAVTSPIMMQQQQQQMQQQMQMQQQQQQQMQARMSNVGTTASSPRAGPPNQWRDKYVMKFSGWRASQPDTGLPPSAMNAAPTSSTPFPPQGTGVGIEHGQPHAGSISEFAASAAVATRSIQVQPPGRLSNNAVLLEDQVGIFNLDQEHGSTGSYSPPVVVGDTMIGIGLEGNSPIVRASNSGSGSGRWSRDPDQFQQQHQPQTRADRNSKSSSF